MKVTAYMRVARLDSGRGTVDARAARPNVEPMKGPRGAAYPTVHFALELDIPDSLIDRAEQIIATVTVPEDQAEIAAVVAEVEAA